MDEYPRFYGEIRIIIPELSPNYALISSLSSELLYLPQPLCLTPVGSTSDGGSRVVSLNPSLSTLFMEIDHDIISKVILPLPLIKKVKVFAQALVYYLEDKVCQGSVSRLTDQLNMALTVLTGP